MALMHDIGNLMFITYSASSELDSLFAVSAEFLLARLVFGIGICLMGCANLLKI